MRFVGKINRKIYSCITKDIVTDDVIVTEKQIKHILDRHPDAYEKTIVLFKDILNDPDYIIKDEKHNNTGLVIKRFKTDSGSLQMVLRIVTKDDDPSYKNSIISCWKISDSRLGNYLRNKEILYKKE